jgi:hypothetical protein
LGDEHAQGVSDQQRPDEERDGCHAGEDPPDRGGLTAAAAASRCAAGVAASAVASLPTTAPTCWRSVSAVTPSRASTTISA